MNLQEQISRIKSMMNVLSESKQVGVLYHNTTIEKAIKILETNQLIANVHDYNELTDYRTIRDYNFLIWFGGNVVIKDRTKLKPYVSFTRNKSYKRYDINVQFILDGDKISENYEVIPYSHFGGRKLDEMEERVYKTIKNLNRYIIKVILDVPNEEIEKILNDMQINYLIR